MSRFETQEWIALGVIVALLAAAQARGLGHLFVRWLGWGTTPARQRIAMMLAFVVNVLWLTFAFWIAHRTVLWLMG
jgi:hypothetical protein